MGKPLPPPSTPAGVGQWVHPAKGNRNYVNTATGEMISRRQYDEHFGRLKRAGIISNEQQGKLRRQAGVPVGPARPRNPAKAPKRPKGPPTGGGGRAPQFYIDNMRDVIVYKPSKNSPIVWRRKSFPNLDEASFYILSFLRRFFPGEGVYVVAHGVLNAGVSGGADEIDEAAAAAPEWRTIMPFTALRDFTPADSSDMVREAERIFDVGTIDAVEVRWRAPGQAQASA